MRWFFTRLRGGETTTQVASIDRFGVVRKETRNSSSDVSIERKDTNTYLLNIHGTRDTWVFRGKWSQVTIEGSDHSAQSSTQTVSSSSDSGEYHCVTTPWYLSASTGAWTEGGELTSSRIFLTVRFAGEQWTAPTVVPIVCLVQSFWASYLPLLQCGNPSSYRSYTASQLL